MGITSFAVGRESYIKKAIDVCADAYSFSTDVDMR